MKNVLFCLLSVFVILTTCFTNLNLKLEETKEEMNKRNSWVEEQINNMSIEEKIGQMLIVTDSSTIADEDLLKN